MAGRRGRENLPRELAIYLVRRYTRESLREVGRHFGLDSYSTVSSAVRRVKVRSKQDHFVRSQLGKLERRLNESQKQT